MTGSREGWGAVNEPRKTDSGFCDWFAGFVAADGCFYSVLEKGSSWPQPRFMIHLRDDDLDIILEIQDRLGVGRIYSKPSYRKGDSPAVQLQVAHSDDLIKLIAIFDKYPIRAKKQRDYVIWRELVSLLRSNRDTRDRERIQYLHRKLRFIKQYDSEAVGLPEFERQGMEQLGLGLT